jgi:xylulokinase
MKYLLGIDVGTSSMKTLLIDEEGNVVGSATELYPFETPKPLWSEQDPSHWWKATCQSIKRVLEDNWVDAKDVAALGLTGQMQTIKLRALAFCGTISELRSNVLTSPLK